MLPSCARCHAAPYYTSPKTYDIGFTDEAGTRKMHAEFAAASVDPRHVLDDPPDDLGELVELVVAALERGTMTYELGS